MAVTFKVLFNEVKTFFPTLECVRVDLSTQDINLLQNEDVGKSRIIENEFLIYRDTDEIVKYHFSKVLEPFENKFLEMLFDELFKCYVTNKHDKPEDFSRFVPGYVLNAICKFTNKNTRFKVPNTKDTFREAAYFDHPNTMVYIVDALISWIGSRNEGKQPDFSFTVLDDKEGLFDESKMEYLKVVTEKYFERLSVAESSSILLDKYGGIVKHISVDSYEKQIDLDVPDRINDIISTVSKYAYKENKSFITIMLMQGRDVLIIRDGDLIFARRGAHWKVFNEKIVRENLKWKNKKFGGKLTSSIYRSLIDASFSYGGAGLAVLDVAKDEMSDEYLKKLITYIDEEYIYDSDIFDRVDNFSGNSISKAIQTSEYKNNRRKSIQRVIGYNNTIRTARIINCFDGACFVDRHLLKELMSIDGSTILDKNGAIIAVGALVKKHTQIAEGGARLAAAVAISEIGLGIKISEDGKISGYRGGKPKDGSKLTAVFEMG